VSEGDVAELGARFASGDESALRDAYGRWAPMLFRMARRAVGTREDAEDVVQAVFVAAWRGRDGFDPARSPLPAWLTGITRHHIADALASRARADRLVAQQRSLAEADPGADDHFWEEAAVAAELRRLEPVPRRVVELAYFAQFSHSEIAAELGIPLGTVKSHLRRSITRIRRDWGVSDDE
jgi:RNA polymerase sigma factor (sigma-70 family)